MILLDDEMMTLELAANATPTFTIVPIVLKRRPSNTISSAGRSAAARRTGGGTPRRTARLSG